MAERLRNSPLKNATFRLLWVGQSASALGDQIFLVALLLHVYGAAESATNVAALLLVGRVVPAFIAPFGAALSQRVGKRMVLIGSELARLAMVMGMAFSDSLALTILLFFLLGLAGTFFRPVFRATIPQVMEDDQLRSANALNHLTFTGSVMIGPAIGGFFMASIGYELTLAMNAFTFMVSAILISFARLPEPISLNDGSRVSVAENIKTAGAIIRNDKTVLGVVLTATALVLFAPMVNPAEVVLITETLGGSDLEFGLVTSAWGVGMVLGSGVLLLARRWNATDETLYVQAFLVQGVIYISVGIAPSVAYVIALYILGGLGNGMDVAVMDTLLQKRVPQDQHTWVFAALHPIQRIAGGVALAGGGIIADLASPRLTFFAAGSGLLLAAVVGRFFLSQPRRSTEATEELAKKKGGAV